MTTQGIVGTSLIPFVGKVTGDYPKIATSTNTTQANGLKIITLDNIPTTLITVPTSKSSPLNRQKMTEKDYYHMGDPGGEVNEKDDGWTGSATVDNIFNATNTGYDPAIDLLLEASNKANVVLWYGVLVYLYSTTATPPVNNYHITAGICRVKSQAPNEAQARRQSRQFEFTGSNYIEGIIDVDALNLTLP